MGEKGPSNTKKAIAVAITSLVVFGIAFTLLYEPKEDLVDLYRPTLTVPDDFMVMVEFPRTMEDMTAIACLTPLLFMNGTYHPLMILGPDGPLSRQEIFTLSHLNTDRPKLLLSNTEGLLSSINSQLTEAGVSPIEEHNSLPLTSDICTTFYGFDGVITVSTYEEALWACTIAKNQNLAMMQGPPTYTSQEEVWQELSSMGIQADYIVATNPYDLDIETLSINTLDYDEYDNAWFCPALSVVTAELGAYHDAYIITNATPSSNTDWDLDMALSQNRRATGYLEKIRSVSRAHGPAEYIAIVGSASAVPQFLMKPPGEGALTNSDIIYGFLDDDIHTMDAGIGRIIQYDVSLASNQLVKSFLFDDFTEQVHVDYRDIAGGPHEKEWRKHGASFSGFEITYERMQATPGRWICTDLDDAGFTYDYVGPSSTGVKLADGVQDSKENDLVEICKGSGYVAYRGHGSDEGSIYMIRVYGPNGEEHQLSYQDAANMDVPPQVAFFVSCLNGKIYGHGPGTEPQNDVDFERLFTLNYLSAGPAVLIGATEVSYSNIGQDLKSIPAEYLPFKDDHEWDHNDAWYAFVWDGILNHPKEHGTAGKAVQWSENRYMKYPPNDGCTPFEPKDTVDWREVTFFTMYGDPAFRPAIDINTQPGYDPWHNGADDY